MLWRRNNNERYCPACRERLTDITADACPACQRPFDPEDPGTTSPHDKAYCVSCGYDTLGLDAGPCPECGADYDPLDPKRFTTTPERTAAFQRRALRIVLLSVVVGVLAVLVQRTIIPRPGVRIDGSIAWTAWLWLDETYGRETLSPAPDALALHVWKDKVVRVEGTVRVMAPAPRTPPDEEAGEEPRPLIAEAAPTPIVPAPDTLPPAAVVMRPTGELASYSVERDENTWTISAPDAGVPWAELLLAFNSTREPSEVMGVRIAGAERDVSDEPFEVTGDARDVLQALVDTYGLTLLPGVTLFDREHVWAVDDEGQIVRQHVSEAEARGERVPLIHGGSVARIRFRLR